MRLLVVLVHFGRIIHRAEFGAAHGAEGGFFVGLVGQSLVVHRAGGLGIQRQRELFLPVKFVAGVAEGVVAVAGAGASAGDVGGVGGNFVGDDAVLHVFFVWQTQVLFRGNVAEHGSPVPSDHGGADGAGNVVIAGSDVGDQRSQGVERGFVAEFDFFFDLLLDLVHGDVAGAFGHDLNVVLPGDFR